MQQNSILTKGELGCVSPALVWEARGGGSDSRRRVTPAFAHAGPSARLPCALGGPRGQASGERGGHPQHRGCHQFFSEVPEGRGGPVAWEQQPGPATPGHVPARPARDGWSRRDCKIQMCFLPRGPRPAPRSRSRPLTLQLARPGWGPVPSVDTKPRGLKGSQAKPVPPDAGNAVATHSTKCWHLHPHPEGRLPLPPPPRGVTSRFHWRRGLARSRLPRTWLEAYRPLVHVT